MWIFDQIEVEAKTVQSWGPSPEAARRLPILIFFSFLFLSILIFFTHPDFSFLLSITFVFVIIIGAFIIKPVTMYVAQHSSTKNHLCHYL